MKKFTIPNLLERHRKGAKIVMVTAYDATFAKMADEAGVEIILVGDSLGQVIQGHDSTIPVTLEELIYHTRCVSRGVRSAVVIADLPFMSYQASHTQAMLAAGRALKEGSANAVKLEGGIEMAETVRLLVAAGVPVMAHIGLKPQRINVLGGYKIHGKTTDKASSLIEEAKTMEEAGAFSIVLEGIAIETAREITNSVSIPTIGISSGPHCSGQVLVIYDLLGFNPEFKPTFLKTYADGYKIVTDSVRRFADDVRSGSYPTEAHGFHRKAG